MGPLNSIGNKACGLGGVVSAMGCSACFPALAGFGGATGMGFLSQYEGLFISVSPRVVEFSHGRTHR